MTALSVKGVTKAFLGVPVLRGIDLDVPGGGLTAILGPSGCGKTTLLRLIVGFDQPDAGTISIGGCEVSDGRRGLPPERRGVGFVAQEGALFPHLTVAGNITFGLRRAARRDRSRVAELLELVGLPEAYAGRQPHQLSGGEQQRVALARALAPRPSLVLLDEPFAALDAALRTETRTAVLAALAACDTTAVLVTHDQSEALSVAKRVAIMRDGVLVQTAPPADLYTTPVDSGVAGFVGDAVLLRVTGGDGATGCAQCVLGQVPVRGAAPGRLTTLMLRPEQIRIHPDDCDCGCGGRADGVPARVETRTYYGHDATVTLRIAGHDAQVMARCFGHALPRPGATVTLTVDGAALAYPFELAESGPHTFVANGQAGNSRNNGAGRASRNGHHNGATR